LLEILVISDGSTDQTEPIAQEFAAHGVRLISVSRGGKAAALNAGLRRAQGEILFFTDVRQDLDPAALRELVACFQDPSVGVASGELLIRDGETREEANVGLYWRYEKWIRRRLSRIDSVLGATGCIYAMRRKLAVEMPEDTLLDDVYLPMAAFFRGYRVILDDDARAFDVPMSLDAEFRRKVRTLAGVYQVMRQYPKLLGPSNRMWLHFISHKFGRLLLPFALAALAVASFGLPIFWANVALTLQCMFYLLAGIDRWIPEHWPLKSFSSPARTFVAFMFAALAAVSFFFVPSSRFWSETKPARVGS
jgi:cellulose synthase/poly-beta-1,6-N-acetylglucosamine synthase-like glycosyltransferase